MIFRSGLPKSLIHLVAITALSVVLPACGGGDDDDLGDPGDGGNDTVAPIVVQLSPRDGGLIADLNTTFYIQFNEDMDPSSAAGNITLSPGTIGPIVWANPTAMLIGPTNMPEATEVTFTISTGMTDSNGNNLAAPFTATYTTIANQLALVEVSPAAGAMNVNRNTNIDLKFTEPVRNLLAGITISDGNKIDYPFSPTGDNRGNHTLNPVDVLPENTEFTVTISTLVIGGITETSLASDESFSFTTGLDLDNTPPNIVSITPASGSTFPVDQGTLTIEFDEAIDLTKFKPTSMNGQLAWAIIEAGLEPELSPDGTMLTIYLPAVMPAGLSLEVVLANYEDLYSNIQSAETAWSATVAGDASPLYLKDDYRYTASGAWEEGELGNNIPTSSNPSTTYYYEIGARSAINQWELREYEWQYSALDYFDILSVTSSEVALQGFAEDVGSGFQEFMISSPLLILELPFVASSTWTSTGSVTIPEGTLDVVMEGQVDSTEDLVAGYLDNTLVTWTDAWKVVRDVTISESGEVTETENIQQWIVPGIGIIREMYYEESFVPGATGWTSYDVLRDLDGALWFFR